MRTAFALLVATGCNGILGIPAPTHAADGSVSIDAPFAPDARRSFDAPIGSADARPADAAVAVDAPISVDAALTPDAKVSPIDAAVSIDAKVTIDATPPIDAKPGTPDAKPLPDAVWECPTVNAMQSCGAINDCQLGTETCQSNHTWSTCSGDVPRNPVSCDDAKTLDDGCGNQTHCPLGCDATMGRCLDLLPSNGVTLSDVAGVASGIDLVLGQTAMVSSDTGTGAPGGVFISRNGFGILAVDHLKIASNATLRVYGMQPLIIVSANDVSIDGLVDVSGGICTDGTPSPWCGGPGGGGEGVGCGAGGFGARVGGSQQGGGGGGGYGTNGASGGTGGSTAQGGMGGPSCGVGTLGGLMGGSGGGGTFGSTSQEGGGGGGAVQITSFGTITIGANGSASSSGVNAAGEGGTTMGCGTCAAGGGGSGGGILLEAPTIKFVNGLLAANGGGGASGSCSGGRLAGQNGPFSLAAAQGGSLGTACQGGSGGSYLGGPQAAPNYSGIAGGGGGAVGRIAILAGDLTMTGATSPNALQGTPMTQ